MREKLARGDNLGKNTFSPQRSRAPSKPQLTSPDITFYSCEICTNIVQSINPGSKCDLLCCNKKLKIIRPIKDQDVAKKISLDYKIMGGYNSNVIKVYWKEKKEGIKVKWIYLRTFTGGQIKYVNKNKKSFVFALADEDAYVYCDESPCLECTFRCKRGFEIYAYIEKIGLVKMPIDRMQHN